MRAVIDGAALGSGRGGDESMLRAVIGGLGLVGEPEDRYTVLADAGVASLGLAAPTVRVEVMARRPGAAHFALQLPSYLRRRGGEVDAVFTVTHAPLGCPVPVALMVLDLSFLHLPDAYPRATRLRLASLVGHQVHRVGAVVTVSEFCRRDLIETYGLAPSTVHVVPLAVEPWAPLDGGRRAVVEAQLAAQGVGSPYLLYLGNLHPRKNVARTIRAFARARSTHPALRDHRLVIAGARWWGAGEAEAAADAPAGSVAFLGRVDDDTRRVLLDDAVALVYVSRFEGFGLPPLEAMAAGTPVVAADAAALPETTGGAALLVDPEDDAALCAALCRVVTDGALRAELVRRGRARVAHYDLARTGTALRGALASASVGRRPVPS